MHIAIVDDLEQDIETLLEGIQNWFQFHTDGEELICDRYHDGLQFLDHIQSHTAYDLIFLDICMEQMDGMKTAQKLREAGSKAQIVFVTTEKQYALDAFQIHPFDYLVKPYTKERLNSVLQDVMSFFFHSREEITVRVAYGEMTIPLRTIISTSAAGHGTEILLSDGTTVQSLQTFSETEKKLLPHQEFLTINRALCINMDHILQLREDKVVMKGKVSYPLKYRGRGQLMRVMTQYQIQNRMRGV